ncbi:hypothetical protein LB533_20380 [Mesorhizobium sp. BR1-1-13]|uniref:hypothetical protein n=1 Tax=Mesorhizobium sp. BR1-1-13 TaxID=2876656 RepID=UPI001CD157E4|nr:hypothetical protein [Mesorhizobium sp. BR1-1-13]MBZ9943447.1 hypothetical protein [Mesorhizobium sp. BR1-1-13]
MRIQALKTLLDGSTTTRKGTIYEEEDLKARELIGMGYAVHLPEPEESVAAPIAFLASNDNKDERADPFTAPLTGFRDGLEQPASSLQADQAQQKRTYRKRAAGTKS